MSDDVKARAREALDGLNDDAWSIDVLTASGAWSDLTADLLAALEAAEAERDAARAVIRQSWEYIAAREGLGVYDRQALLNTLGGEA